MVWLLLILLGCSWFGLFAQEEWESLSCEECAEVDHDGGDADVYWDYDYLPQPSVSSLDTTDGTVSDTSAQISVGSLAASTSSATKRDEWVAGVVQGQRKAAAAKDTYDNLNGALDARKVAAALAPHPPGHKKHRRQKNGAPPIKHRNEIPLPPPKEYANVAQSKGRSYWDPEMFTVKMASKSKYRTYGYLSHGGFSQVYRGRVSGAKTQVVIKVLTRATGTALAREVMMLRRMGDVDDVVPLLDVIPDQDSGSPALVFPLINNTYYKDVFPSFGPDDVRRYTFRVARVLAEAHKRGIIHGDMKPLNVLLDHSRDQVFVSDWGLAHFYFPDRLLSPRSGTRFWKAPELLLGCPDYAYGVDVWAMGVMFAGMLNNTFHLFAGHDSHEQLAEILQFTGSEEFTGFTDRFKITLSSTWAKKYLSKPVRAHGLDFDTSLRSKFLSKDALDLAYRMLTFDPSRRITMKEVVAHPYFSKERERLRKEQGS